MNRAEFMRQLESLLQSIPEAEREEALQYYNDYFDDAGSENEQDVLTALGTPAKVAENIKKDWLGYGDSLTKQPVASDRALMEYGTGQDGTETAADATGRASAFYNAGNDGTHTMNTYADVNVTPIKVDMAQEAKTPQSDSTKLPGWAIALIIVLIVLASPIGMGLLGLLFGLVVIWFAFIFAFGVVSIALFLVFLILFGTGVASIFVEPGVGLSLLGGSLLCGGIALLFLMLTVVMAGWATPGICKGIGSLFRRR